MSKTTVTLVAIVAVFSVFQSADAARRPSKINRTNVSGIRLHEASGSPMRGFTRVLAETPRPLYFDIEAAISGNDVEATETRRIPNGMDVVLFLRKQRADHISGLLQKLDDGELVIFDDGTFIGKASFSIDSNANRVTLKGLTSAQAVYITGILGGSRNGVPVTLRPNTAAIQPGDELTIDVFVDGIPSLRAYQISLKASGGAAGKLDVSDLSIDETRSDNVFTGKQALKAIDRKGKRAGAVLMTGSARTDKPTYLATFKLKASSDAAGAFRVDVRTTQGMTVLTDADSQPVPLLLRPVVISVGAQSALP